MRRFNKLTVAVVLALGGVPIVWAQTAMPIPSTSETADPNAPSAQTQPLFNYAVGLGIGHSDNVNRSQTDTTSQDLLQPTFNFTYNQQGSTLQTQVIGSLQYVDFIEGYFGNEFRGQLTGLLNWTISPGRLNFVAQDYSSVEPVSIRSGNSPANQQQVNVLVAGPTLSFRLGAQSSWNGQMDLRYINTTASKTKDFESQRGMGAFRLLHDLSATDHLSLNFEGEDVHFENVDPAIEADRYAKYNTYARYVSNLQKVDLDFSLGASRINFDGRYKDHSGALANASISWRVDSRNTLQLAGSDQMTDATSNLAQAPSLAAVELTSPTFATGRAAISPAVFRNLSASVAYLYQGERYRVSLSPYYMRLRQLNGNDLSRNDYGGTVGLDYSLSPLMSLGMALGRRTSTYLSDHSRDHENTATINLTRLLTPNWSWSVALSHDQLQSSRAGYGYTENEVFVYVYYRR